MAPLGWPFELFAHFRWQLCASAGLLLACAMLLGDARASALALLALALPLLPLLPASRDPGVDPVSRATDCSGEAFSIATFNLWYRPSGHQRVRAWLATEPADVVVVQELTHAWVAALQPLETLYPHRHLYPRDDPYGIGVLSRIPLARVETADLADDGLPSLVAIVEAGGRRTQVIGLHTAWPVLPQLQRARDRALARAAELAREAAIPTVLAGDLNLTPYAPGFARLVRDSGLQDAQAGRAWRPTWQAPVWPLALPIDHVLVPAEACVVEAGVGPELGSDHRPVTVRLRWP